MSNLVSVIIPCYNAEKTIKGTLDSLARQTFKNFDVICINDGSKDNTLQIIENYKKKSDLMIYIYSIENSGVSAARNYGMERAKGKYLMFLDADDKYAPGTIELLACGMEEEKVDTVYGYWSNHLENLDNSEAEGTYVTQEDMMRHFMYRNKPISFFNFIYVKQIIDIQGIRFEEGIRYGEDNLFFWKYLNHIERGLFYDKAVYWYFQNADSAMHNPDWKIVDSVKAILLAEDYLKDNGFLFLDEFSKYMPARTKFAIIKEFARYRQKENYMKFCNDYKGKKAAKTLMGKNGFVLTLCAGVFCFSPRIFFDITGIVYKWRK